MDPAWLAAANAALEPAAPASERYEVGLDEEVMATPDCSPTIAALDRKHETRIRAPYELEGEQGDPFRAMIDCEAVNRRLEWIVGEGFTVTGGYAILSQHGAAGQRMHAGPFYGFTSERYRPAQTGRKPLHSPGLNLGWALRDVITERGDGGLVRAAAPFACFLEPRLAAAQMLIPGSHNARLPLPLPPTWSCDLPQGQHVELNAGDVVIYMV